MYRLIEDFAHRSRVGVLLLLGVALTFGACSEDAAGDATEETAASSAGQGTAFPLTATDPSGVELTFEAPPERIVSYSPGATEVLFAIGAGDLVAAADEFSDYPSAAAALPKVSYSTPDPEAALSFEPDLVIMAERQADQVPQFRNAGLTVFDTGRPDSLEEVYAQIELLGRITGHERGAAEVIEDMRSRIAAVEATLGEIEAGPRVFFELTPDLYTVAPDTFVGALITLLKGQNVAEGSTSQFPQLSNEAVLAADPEVIFLTDAEFGESLETVAARPGWDAVSAVAEGRVYPLDGDLASRPGPRLADAVEVMAAALYPDLFE